MRKKSIALVMVMVLGAALLLTAVPARAQSDETGVTCDSTLVLLLALAEQNYGFQPMTDVSGLNYGQYSAWFSTTAQGPAGPAMTPEASDMTGSDMAATQPATSGDMSTMATEEPGMATGATLLPGNIPGEDPVCTQLRQELETYLVGQLSAGASGQIGQMDVPATGVEATAAANG